MPAVEKDVEFRVANARVVLGHALLEKAILAFDDEDPLREKVVKLALEPASYSVADLKVLSGELIEASYPGINELGLIPSDTDPVVFETAEHIHRPLHAWDALAAALRHVVLLDSCSGISATQVPL